MKYVTDGWIDGEDADERWDFWNFITTSSCV